MIKHFKVTLLTSFASIFFVLSFLSMFNVSFAGFENGVGFSMEPNTVSLPAKDMINSNVGSRTYTIDELFSRSAGFAIPYGQVLHLLQKQRDHNTQHHQLVLVRMIQHHQFQVCLKWYIQL